MIETGFIGGESDSAFAERKKLRAKYIATCKKGKQEFGDAIAAANSMMKTLGGSNKKIARGVLENIDDDTASKASNYKKEVYEIVDNDQSLLGDAAAGLKVLSGQALANHNKHKAEVAEAIKESFRKKAMLLQTGQ